VLLNLSWVDISDGVSRLISAPLSPLQTCGHKHPSYHPSFAPRYTPGAVIKTACAVRPPRSSLQMGYATHSSIACRPLLPHFAATFVFVGSRLIQSLWSESGVPLTTPKWFRALPVIPFRHVAPRCLERMLTADIQFLRQHCCLRLFLP
jgi:hypothetical protein